MPAQVEVNIHPLRLSPEFRYRVLDGDPLFVGDDQGVSGPFTNEDQLKPGDWIDSRDHVFAVSVGTARLEQYSHDESDPPEPKKSAPKKKSSKKSKK